MGGPGGRKVNKGTKKGGGVNKRVTRKQFLARHVDQVWEDVRKPASEVHVPGAVGPMGTTAKAGLDEDVPGYGKFYCIPCSRYFQSADALTDHEKTKPHKRTAKMLLTTQRPHNQQDAEAAAGMGKNDKGQRLRAAGAAAMDM